MGVNLLCIQFLFHISCYDGTIENQPKHSCDEQTSYNMQPPGQLLTRLKS